MLIWANFAFAQKRGDELRGMQADKVFKGAALIWQKNANTIPAFIQLRAGAGQDEETFLAGLKSQFQLPASYSFQLSSEEADQLGWQHKRYNLTINGVPVANGNFVLHISNGKVQKYNGYIFRNVSVSSSPAVNEAAALNAALADVGAATYKWQLPAEEKFLKSEQNNLNATFYPKGALTVLQLGGNGSTQFSLAWKFDIYAHEPMERYDVYIDAQTGVVLQKISRMCAAHEHGTAVTGFSGTRSINTDSYNGAYRLRDNVRGINTFNLQNTSNYAGAVDFTDADNYWNNVNIAKDQYATDAHWGAAITYDMFQSMGRNSLDNNGYPLNLYMHYNTNYLNAFWDGSRMIFGDGNTVYKPFAPLDITGHEISHGLAERTANLIYQGEPGALNESFSDIFGACVEWQGDSANANWLIGEKVGFTFRSMSNPNAYGDPDTYQGNYWYTGGGDFGGVHTNSGVQNYWFYLLSMGGNGTNDLGRAFSVSGIGRGAARQIAWRNLVYYLTASSDYEDARFYSIQAAIDLYGMCSPQLIAVTKAWAAAGVGADYVSGAAAQFTVPAVNTCSAPVNVSFTNTSYNTSSYLWQFGDGTTSTDVNPVHTYTAPGVYSVKLIANGGACGADTFTVSNVVNINAANACNVTMPAIGTYQLQTSCSGIVYDDGGAGNSYSSNTNSLVTIAPVNAARVVLHFTQFSMEPDYDYLYIYDGPTVLSPVLAVLTGNTIPADVVSNSSVVTIRQMTNGSVSANGFTLQWNCIAPNSIPVVNFKAENLVSCSGNVQFTNLTANGASSYLWSFGDGTTSMEEHPVHQYVQNGNYTVSLKAINAIGSNTAVKTSYITIGKPQAPHAYTTTACGPSEVTAVVPGTNDIKWYTATGDYIGIAPSYTTPVLNASTDYFIEEVQVQPIAKAGPLNSSIGTGEIYNGNTARALTFTVSKPGKLVSVYVHAQGAGLRTVQYRDALGAVLAERTVYCENGGNRITLNIDLLPGGPYQLGLSGNINLYKNNTGAVYPYNDANGIVSITGNNAPNGAAQYYYFYDWEVREHDCISERGVVPMHISPAILADVQITAPSCFGKTDAGAAVEVQAGSPPYSYRWSNFQNDSAIAGLAAGTYSVTVIDDAGCMFETTQVITEPAPIAIDVSTTPDTCYRSVGSVVLSISGGTAPYTHTWNTPQSVLGNVGFAAGTYAAMVKDSKGCAETVTAMVENINGIHISTSLTAPLCYGDKNNALSAIAASGTAPFSYVWSNGANTAKIENVEEGNYEVTVIDVNHCSASATVSMVYPTAIEAVATVRHITCFRDNNGSIEMNATGGTGNYTYRWANGNAMSAVSGLAAGVYTVTVSDDQGCSAASSVTVHQPGELQFATASNFATTGNDGVASVSNISGGTAPYTTTWSNGHTGLEAARLAAGRYNVTVTDAKQCYKETSVNVMQITAVEDVADDILLTAFPNPAATEVTIMASNLHGAATLTIKNALGQTILDDVVEELTLLRKINVAQLPQGIYLIELRNDNMNVVKELVVTR